MTDNLTAPPRTAELWAAIRDRLKTARMTTVLGGAGRVFVEGEYSGPQWAENASGGRVVVVPTVHAVGGGAWVSGEVNESGFLIRSDFNNYRADGYDPAIGLEATQREAFDLLQYWPGGTYSRVMVARTVYLVERWQPRPLYDEATGTVFLSSYYRVGVAEAP